MIPTKIHVRTSRGKARLLEILEDRCLLSAAHFGGNVNTITFNLAPVAVQKGLDTLAENGGLADLSADQNVYLGNRNGAETYTADISSSGSSTVFTVDQSGSQVTAPVKSSTTFGAISNADVTNEFNTIATALNLTAPASTTNVKVVTNSDKSAVYSLTLASASSTGRHVRWTTISVDSNGDPTGNQTLPLSVLSAAIQNGLTSNAPKGATALTSTSPVSIQTHNGVTTYSATYRSTGIRTTVTVDNTGAMANLPSTSTAQFSAIPAAAQTELQALAAANGYSGTIAGTQKVIVYDEANGTTIYGVRLPVSGTSSKSGATYTYLISVASDQAGNPTVPPRDGFGLGGGWGFGGIGWGWGFGGFGGGMNSGGSSVGFHGPVFSGFSGFARAAGFRF